MTEISFYFNILENMEPRYFTDINPCFGIICSGNSDICVGGNCTCGGGPVCSGTTDACTSGVCTCGGSLGCTGDATCDAGKCSCDGVICGSPFSNNCVSGVCKCGMSNMCATKSTLSTCLNSTGETPEDNDTNATCQVN